MGVHEVVELKHFGGGLLVLRNHTAGAHDAAHVACI